MHYQIHTNRLGNLPMVISSRLTFVATVLKAHAHRGPGYLINRISFLFNGTKVQVGDYLSPVDNYKKKHLFIRNGLKGRAQILIIPKK